MKIDRGRLKKSTTEVPLECRELIDRLRGLSKHQLLDELSKVTTWIFGKCELFHWADILDEFDTILGDAAASAPNNKWALACDISFTNSEKKLLLWVLHFTTLLIEHSFSRHMYNSMEHLLTLLGSNDMSVVLSVLNLLYMFSKRSNFITRLPTDKRSNLVARLTLLAESWGGKESGFGLADCCSIDRPVPPSATTLHFEYHREQSNGKDMKNKHNIEYIHIENVDELRKNPAEIMFGLLGMYSIPADKEMALFTHVRLAYRFNHYGHRVLCVLARLQALSVLVYSNAIQDNAHSLLYSGLLEELVELVELKFPYLVEIRAAALRTLTSIIHLDRNPHFPKRPGSRLSSIIEVTGANQYHGFLPVLVRHCISSLIRQIPTWETYLADVEKKRLEKQAGNDPLTTKDAATSPMYAIYDSRRSLEDTDYDSYSDSESDGDDIHSPPFIPTVADREPSPEPENPSKYLERMRDAFQDNEFKTEYPLPLATALFSFLYHLASYEAGGDALVSCGMMESLLHVVNWHGIELEHITFVTRAVRVIDLITNIDMQAFHTHGGLQSFITRLEIEIEQCRRDQLYEFKVHEPMEGGPSEPPQELPSFDFTYHANNVGKSCLPQRAALLKSMLNFMKKALQDTTFAESIRHLMEGTLPSSLKHIILNAEYYGPSLFLLATDVVTVYVFQEPSLLSTLQDNGLTDVVLYALLIKDVPATREVLSSLPNVFSALCLNTRGLNAFVKCKPFDRLFKVLLSSNYLNAMRRRRSSDPLGDTASNLGNAMDELIRHQPSLKVDATAAIIKLLNELCTLGTDPKYICWRPHNKSDLSPTNSSTQTSNNEASSDEEDDDEDEPSSSSQQQTTVDQAPTVNERIPIALVDYILNVMKFIDAILSNNSTDDHCKEFVNQGGLVPLLKILGLPNLPVDCPVTTSSQSVASVCKSILNLSQEPKVLKQGMKQLNEVLQVLKPLYTRKPNFIGSKLLQELTDNAKLDTAFSTASATPLLHAMGAAHGYVHMFVHVCRTGQNDIRNLSLQHWGSVEGIVVLEGLAELYTALVWESTLLLALCSDDVIPSDCDFGKEEMEKLSAAFADSSGCSTPACSTPVHTADNAGSVTSALEALSTNMSVDSEGEIPSSKPTTQQLAYIKPLLGASSRLGRALAELFGLLVKLCVGSPVRQRRGQNVVSSPQVPNVHARNVATALNKLLANGLSADHLPPSPVPKFRLTFLICSVGFTSPMLFDEKRYPYHLMLQKFVAMGGQATFFATFKWALTAGGTYPLDMLKPDWNVPDGTGEFLDVWLTLLEKMVNPKAILESPHVIATKASADGTSKQSGFDPMKYLIKIHKSAFKAVMCLWGRKPLPNYGERMTDSMLSILKHILRGEKLIKERLHKTDDSKSEATASTSTAAGPSTVRPPAADVDPENLRQLMDMGFCREYALEALLHTLNIEQATEYLLANARPAQAGMEVDDEDDQVMTAICISILAQSTPGSSGERDDAAASSSTASEAKAKETKSKQDEEDDDEDDDDDETPLADSYIDAFTESAVDICLVLIEQIPECVYKVCDLLVTVMKRNGEAFRDQMLDRILMEIHYTLSVILGKYEGRPASMEMYEDLVFAVKAYQLGYYTHLYTLFFEVPVYFDMRVPCGFAVHRAGLLNDLLRLVSLAETLMTELRESHEPKWLAPVLLLTDSLCKVATCTQRKREMHLVTSRLWKWYDLVTGKWTPYSTSNYRLINDAYWNGEQTVRVTFGRRRYTVNFNNMEMYDEGGNKKPITMRLLNSIFDYCTDVTKPVPDDAEDKRVPLTEKEEKRCIPFPSITTSQVHTIIRCCVHLMNLKIDKDLLHAILRVCVRLTRDFENAKLFVHLGGVNCLLNMRQSSMFSGFEILVTILIRHTLEEPAVLAYAMEKVIRCRTGVSIPPPYKDLIYMIRQIGAAVTRDPTTFYQVARNILRIDTSIYRRSFVFTADEVDSRLPIRAEPNTRQHVPNLDEEVSVEVIYDLLYALLQPLEYDSSDYPEVNKTTVPPNPQPSTSKANTESMSHRASNLLNTTGNDDNILETAEDTKNASTTTYTKEFSEEEKSRKPLISKHIIVKMLADAVVSYGSVAKLITEFSYKSGVASVIKEDCTALAYVFDKLLPITENQSDRNTSNMARLLIAAIASCNHQPDAQSTLVSEVKAALNRALMLPESPEKHSQIQLICGIISTMIDNCPKSQIKVKTQSVNINNMVRLMLRKGIMNDLARVPHCLDLSSPNFSYTINAALKPMDSLSLIVNQPLGIVSMAKNKRSQQSNINDVSTQSATSTEATNAQGEEATEDTENTEQDVSAVASSLEVNPSIQNVDDTQSMLDMMDQILERTVNENSGSGRIRPGMDLDDDGNLTYDRDATEELMSTDSGDTESNASDQDGQDDDNDDNDGDDDDMDEVNDNDDNNSDDELNRRFHVAYTMDRDEDILMIQYAEHDHDTDDDLLVRRNENGYNFALFDEAGTSTEQSGSGTITHPLLTFRHNAETNSSAQRAPRGNRSRRYQYVQVNSRAPQNPPAILQRLLGPNAVQTSLGPAQILTPSAVFDSPRVLFMEDLNLATLSEEEINFVELDQSGFYFGPTVAATINHVTSVLYWWTEESKLLDLESTIDCTTIVCNRLVPVLMRHRNEELLERKKKKQLEDEKNKDKKQDSQQDEKGPIEYADVNPAALYEAVINEATATAFNEASNEDPLQNTVREEEPSTSFADPYSRNPAIQEIPATSFPDVTDATLSHDPPIPEDLIDAVLMSGSLLSRSPFTRQLPAWLTSTNYMYEVNAYHTPDPSFTDDSSIQTLPSWLSSSSFEDEIDEVLMSDQESLYEALIQAIPPWGRIARLTGDTCLTTGPYFSRSTTNQEIPTPVPTTGFTDMINAGLLSDLYYACNPLSQETPPWLTTTTLTVQIDAGISSDPYFTSRRSVQEIVPWLPIASVMDEEDEDSGSDSTDSSESLVQAISELLFHEEGSIDTELDSILTTETDDESENLPEPSLFNEDMENIQSLPETQVIDRNREPASRMDTDENEGIPSEPANSNFIGESGEQDSILNLNNLSEEFSTLSVFVDLINSCVTGQRSSPSVFYEESGLDANIVSADQQAEENAAIESVVIEPTPTHNVQETQTQTQSEAETETEVVAEPQTEAPREERDVTMGESSRTVTEEIPEGVDPSFLEALPPDMRSEVLEQHRILRLQQRMSAAVSEQQAAETSAAGTSTAVSPEFLAALPPALQEEVLTQQRLEQQRQAAARANPNEPVDAGAFFETLQPSLRTIILSDMEDSQMSALPPDLAAEAQNLRRDWEARNRQYQQERFLQTNLPNIMRHTSRGRMATRFTNFIPQRGQWASLRDVIYSDPMGGNSRIRGRQLLDHEALSCLLLLLFTDSPHLNKLTLHKVLRNLCYHGPTRDWVIKALLGIIDKSVSVLPEDPFNKPPKKSLRPGPLTSKLVTDLRLVGNGANWLNIRMEAALGCQATVFTVHRSGGKRSDKSPSSISIHPQAAPIVCRNALDLFITLSKSFPTYLLPLKPKDDEKSKANQPNKSRAEATDFWEMLLKLDATSAKKGKSIVSKSHSNLSSTSESETLVLNFDQSAFGQLLVMLSSPVIYRSMPLTDNLLKLLSIITVGMPELVKETGTHKSKLLKLKYESVPAPESAINLAVNVLTYKSCSEEGLEYITTLLLNMANSSLEMSLVILTLLLKAAIRIGETVRQQIDNMLLELHRLNEQRRELASDEPSTSNMKGVLSNRFTNELVVITASAKVKTSCDLQLPSMAPLTSKTSSQVFFLRVLRVIVQIREAIKKKVLQKKEDKATGAVKKESASKKESKLYMESGLKNHYYSCDDEGMIYLNGLSEQLLALDKLWETLSGCLLELEHTPDHHAVLVLQPAVEAFFLVHSPQHGPMLPEKQATATETPAPGQPEAAATSKDPLDTEPAASSSSTSHDQTTGDNSRTNIPPEHLKFLTFAEKHRTVLNQILRQTTTHLADGTFSVLVDHTRVLDFDVKRKYFRTELDRLDQGIRREETAVHVRRSHIFEDSFRELYRRTPEEWKNRFYIVFEDEEGQDAGGLLREWYVIISRDIFNPMYALFTVSPGDRVTYMINSASHYNSNHLCYYKFVGRVIAKAIYDNKLLECYFTRSFYKHILGIRVKYTDMESEDYSFYRGLVYLMENNINNLGLDLTFSTEINEFGVTETRDLIPNGRNVPVTEDNKMEYVRLSCQMKMTGAIRQQLNAFLEGFYDIIPMRLISIFNEQELELLISGLPNVDIEDLRVNTEYHKYQANSLQIQWFWRALRSFDQAERAKFLQFVTGTSKVPLQGFGALEGMNGVQKFQIHRDDRSTDRLPSAHTCFNQLDLPVYETYDKLRSYLLKAIHECSEGFGFA